MFPTETADWITQQFNGSTYVPNNMDVQSEPLYDTLWNPATGAPYAAAAVIPTGVQFFANPAGKTYAQTNVFTAKKLDAPEAFAVMGIRFGWAENILLTDALNILYGFAGEFWIGQKCYNRAPLRFYTPGAGISGFSNISDQSIITNGVPGRQAMHALQINIVIDNQATFYFQLNGSNVTLTASASGGLGAIPLLTLDGLHARGVQ
jgi:hypothetical protein